MKHIIKNLLKPQTNRLKFAPLEFETVIKLCYGVIARALKFAPLEFETDPETGGMTEQIRLKFAPLEFET